MSYTLKNCYNKNMPDLPVRCGACGCESMVDFDQFEARAVSRVIFAHGYVCRCKRFVPVFYTDRALDESLEKLMNYHTFHPKFNYLVKKAVRKAQGLHAKGESLGAV